MEYELSLPVSDRDIKKLRAGDVIYITGQMFTARDEAHHKLLGLKDKDIPVDLGIMALFHCGPLMKETSQGWEAVSAGPTTSSRMEIFEDRFLQRFGVKILVGKGGMGDKTQKALMDTTAVYTSFTGGAGALAADKIKKVTGVYWLEELGMPEAVWVFEIQRFGPLIVSMDAHGKSLYKKTK